VRCSLEEELVMEELKPNIPFLRPGEKVLGVAYLTQDQEIVFTPRRNATEVVLVEAEPRASGPWAVRLRPPKAAAKGAGA
jgi:hypothetical protein